MDGLTSESAMEAARAGQQRPPRATLPTDAEENQACEFVRNAGKPQIYKLLYINML
jgi:hypothetical protein